MPSPPSRPRRRRRARLPRTSPRRCPRAWRKAAQGEQAKWEGAERAVHTVQGARHRVEIRQTAERAILNWDSFNVGRQTTLAFAQKPTDAVLNRVVGADARPSQIQGAIEAAGTVMVVNQNGVVFSGSSQVNVRNLVAAAARITDAQFQQRGLYGADANAATFTQALGKVQVRAGALLSTAANAPRSATEGGGYVLLLGQEVENAGRIVTPGGQAVLAAGDSFHIRRGVGTEGNTASTTRGNEVAAVRVHSDAAPDWIDPSRIPGSVRQRGRVRNLSAQQALENADAPAAGLIVAREGDITLTGGSVEQGGVVVATSSVNARGTVHLLNSRGDQQGRVALGKDAVTAVVLESSGGEQAARLARLLGMGEQADALDSQRDALIAASLEQDKERNNTGHFDNYSNLSDRRDLSRIEIVSGGDIVFEGDSLTLATGGQIVADARRRSFLAERAQLDVSGAIGVQVAMESNSIRVDIQGNELRDAPRNRDSDKDGQRSYLSNQNVWVDRRNLIFVPSGTGGYEGDRWYTAGGLLEVGGYLGNQRHGIGEWAAQGGTVMLAGGEVVTQAGSVVNLAGGTLDVQDGYVRQSWLRASNGRVYTVDAAPGNVLFRGVYRGYEQHSERWGVTRNFYNPLIAPAYRWENGYTAGRDAGRLVVSAPTAVLEGEIDASVYNGARQSHRRAALEDGYRQTQAAVARPGALVLGRHSGLGFVDALPGSTWIGKVAGITAGMGAADDLSADRIGYIRLDAGWINRAGLGGLTIASEEQITIQAPLELADAGRITLFSAEIDLGASITARGGEIVASTLFRSETAEGGVQKALQRDGHASAILRDGAQLDVSGRWVNTLLAPDGASRLAVLDGGAVRLESTGDVTLEAGSVINVSSGAAVLASGGERGGRGGDLSLRADIGFDSATGNVVPGSGEGVLTLDGKISAQGVAGGGTLTLESGTTVVIGGRATERPGVLKAGETVPIGLVLAEDYLVPAGESLDFDYHKTISALTGNWPADAMPDLTGVRLAADWAMPETGFSFLQGVTNGVTNYFYPGQVVPAGTVIQTVQYQVAEGSPFPPGYVVPEDAFPDGMPLQTPRIWTLPTGTPTAELLTIEAGEVLPTGARLRRDAAIGPVLALDAARFQSGFSHYSVASARGILVADGVQLDVMAPALRTRADARQVPSGHAGAALETWTPPLYLRDDAALSLAQRRGASLDLKAGHALGNRDGELVIGSGARVAVDPGQSILLDGSGQITVHGELSAPAGAITIRGGSSRNYAAGRSIWIGDAAVIDVAGRTATATTLQGRIYGRVADGGTITIGAAHPAAGGDASFLDTASLLVIRPGAVLDASGTQAVLDLPGGRTTVASDGGAITLASALGMTLDGHLRAHAGGAGAAGGALTIGLETTAMDAQGLQSARTPRILTVVRDRQPVRHAAGLKPGADADSLPYGQATLSAEAIGEGGFGTLALWSADLLRFEGDVSLDLAQSLFLGAGAIALADATPTAQVSLAAPYVRLEGLGGLRQVVFGDLYPGINESWLPSARNEGRFAVDADLIDIGKTVLFGVSGRYAVSLQAGVPNEWRTIDAPGFARVDLTSRGDIRFRDGTKTDVAGLITAGDLAMTAARIYPATEAVANIVAGAMINPSGGGITHRPDGAIILRGTGDGQAPAPSVFGKLGLTAGLIDQGGVVQAPMGEIVLGGRVLGSSTRLSFSDYGVELQIQVLLRTGSTTSVSAAGLLLPYGGTVDGIEYLHNGQLVDLRGLLQLSDVVERETNRDISGLGRITLRGGSVTAQPGAVLDLRGGGDLAGAGFLSGRGGSVDVLRTALANANPTYAFSAPDNQVYAIVPGYTGYAPLAPDNGAGDPAVGRQITVPEGIPGLAAGTYTLLPSTWAILPGAYRVELGVQPSLARPTALGEGSWLAAARLGLANTGVRDALGTAAVFTAGSVLRTHSQYNETSYSQYVLDTAARFGTTRGRLPTDGKLLTLDFLQAGTPLAFQGEARFAPAEGGYAGTLMVTSSGPSLEVKAAGAPATAGLVSLDGDDLSRFAAGTMLVGGLYSYEAGVPEIRLQGMSRRPDGSGGGGITVREGAVLQAGQIILTAADVRVEGGAVLDTTRNTLPIVDSSQGFVFGNNGSSALVVSEGRIDLLPASAPTDMTSSYTLVIEDDAVLNTGGTIGFLASGKFSLGQARLSARDVAVGLDRVNVGSAQALADAGGAGVLSPGWLLTQTALDRLVRAGGPGAVALERLTLTVRESINFFGDVTLDMRGAVADGPSLVLAAPGLYGWGAAGDTASVAADRIVWNGVGTGEGTTDNPYGSLPAPKPVAGGAGTGSGRLALLADEIVFGYEAGQRSQDAAALDRLALGFAAVDIVAAERVVAANRGSLAVYHSGHDAASYAGGELRISAPLVTAQAGAMLDVRAGGQVSFAFDGPAADPAAQADLGGELRLSGRQIRIDTTVALPSGRLLLTAEDDIELGPRAQIDLSGRELAFFGVSRYSWGGALEMESRAGRIRQAAGSTIDVSARHNAAGSISAVARAGTVSLAGAMAGAGGAGYAQGDFTLSADTIADFVDLNRMLTRTGFVGARSFATRSGDLTVGDEVKAETVTIAVDGGTLRVTGRIDASGARPGTIRLSARDDLVLAPGAALDAHGSVLHTDAYGVAIDAKNRGHVELTAREGSVLLGQDAVIDLSAPDGVARGKVEINAPRVGGDDIAIEAAQRVYVRGAASIAVNGFRRYAPDGGLVDQAYLDAVHLDSAAFVDAALANGALQARLAGLAAHGQAFRLRPGVELVSDGDLKTVGDLDLSGYRYGPHADAAIRGSGEPGVLVMRAGGDLIVEGSINDGFAPPPDTPDDHLFLREIVRVPAGGTRADDWLLETDLTISEAWTVPDTDFYRNFYGTIYDTNWNYYGPGQVVPAGTTLLAGNTTFEANTSLPAYETIEYESGRMWAVAPMLAPGSQSWSMRLVAGADLAAADRRAVRPHGLLDGGGNLVLDDPHWMALDGAEAPSVLRTGTGYLDLLAGGDYRHDSLFGVYTAGTALPAADTAAWDLPRGTIFGSPLGGTFDYEATLHGTRMWFTHGGGDLHIAAGGAMAGYETADTSNTDMTAKGIGDWLWRQGNDALGHPVAWGINFGSYVFNPTSYMPRLAAFSGVGTLGGGNVSLRAGGDAGMTSGTSASRVLEAVVGGSGRVGPDGALHQTGGGDLRIDLGGRLNPAVSTASGGLLLNLRGDISVTASAVGHIRALDYGRAPALDPRPIEATRPYRRQVSSGPVLAPGDGRIRLNARGDLVLGPVYDPTRVSSAGAASPAAQYQGMDDSLIVTTWFSLWTAGTAIDAFAAGGGIGMDAQAGNADTNYQPSALSLVAGGGDIALERGGLKLMPSTQTRLDLLARDSILQGQAVIAGGSVDDIATPWQPGWKLSDLSGYTVYARNYWNDDDSQAGYNDLSGGALFVFGRDDATRGYGTSAVVPMRFYALRGDIVNFSTGALNENTFTGTTFYTASGPVYMRAGRDLFSPGGMILHRNALDVSIIEAGRDIVWADFDIAGPGLLEVSAGRNLYQGGATRFGKFTSLGPITANDRRPGASIVLQAGVGAQGPDWTSLLPYLDPANLLPDGSPLEGSGRVAKTYESELAEWLRERYGFEGSAAEALAYFQGLAPAQQRIFLREVYYAELRAGGREFNDADGPRYGSYLRGRNAIAALFPETDARGRPIDRSGDVIFYGNNYVAASGVRTLAGGDIHVLAPAGQVVVGLDAQVPPASAGLVTMGQGDIKLYSQGSVLLGLSRIMTTFGGDILAWSAQGDINAGRGAKTTLVYTPPRRVYDDVGNVTLSPQAPSSGAGIATLNPIPEVAPGDVDLIAPLGTIDAGEAGIRVSGNVNVAALRVVNAENIQVQGEASGIPVVAAVNVGALTSASAAASSAATAAQEAVQRARAQQRQSLPSIISVQILGFGEDGGSSPDGPGPGAQGNAAPEALAAYRPGSAVQVLGDAAVAAAHRERLTPAERRSLGL